MDCSVNQFLNLRVNLISLSLKSTATDQSLVGRMQFLTMIVNFMYLLTGPHRAQILHQTLLFGFGFG